MGWIANLILLAGALLVGESAHAAYVTVALAEVLWIGDLCRQRPLGRDTIAVCIVLGLLAVLNLSLWLM